MQELRIVVASPNDVAAERQLLDTVVEELNVDLALLQLPARLKLLRWEIDVPPGLNRDGPQGHIDSTLRPDDCDILIAIFWKKLGSPISSSSHETGTQHEIRLAYDAWLKRGRPQIMLYFCTRPYSPRSQAEAEEWGKVLKLKPEYSTVAIIREYLGKNEFERGVRRNLKEHLYPRLQSSLPTRDSTSGQALTFSATACPTTVRAEGLAECVGELQLSCTGGSLSERAGRAATYDIEVFLNTTVANRIVEPDRTTDAYLWRSDGGQNPDDELRGSLVLGVLVGSNSLLFPRVSVPVSDSSDRRVLRICNIRASACSLGVSSTLEPTQIIARVVATPNSPDTQVPPILNMPISLASVLSGFAFRLASTRESEKPPLHFSAAAGINADLAQGRPTAGVINLYVDFIETALRAFRNRAEEHRGELPPFAGVGSAATRGYGTRFRVCFLDVPAGVKLLVTTSEINSPDLPRRSMVALIEAAADGKDRQPTIDPVLVEAIDCSTTGSPVAELDVQFDCATAVWEYFGSSERTTLERIRVGLIVAAPPGAVRPTSIRMIADLAPISVVTAARSSTA